MARAEPLDMTITSTAAGKRIADISDARDNSLCETCWSPVALTASVLLKGSHIVGCPSCDWGAARLQAARVARALTAASPLRAFG
jgi:hypothetical protein